MKFNISNYLSTNLFDLKQIVKITAYFTIAVLLINLTAKVISLYLDFGFSTYWPFGIFHPRVPTIENFIIGLLSMAVFIAIIQYYSKILSRTTYFYGTIILLILLSNSIQGFEEGFKRPVSGGENKQIQYYHDALEIESSASFLKNHTELLPELRQHSKIHPPGAPLFYYFADKVGLEDWMISILILLLSAAISMLALRHLLSIYFPDEDVQFGLFLYFLLPSVQIYYLSTIDALVTSFLLLTLSFYLISEKKPYHLLSTIFALSAALFLNFASTFIFPVIFGYEFFRKKRLNKSFIILWGVILTYLILYVTSGFNFIDSLLTASKIENPNGFRLFHEPIKYIFSRIESTIEPLIFFGPFLIILFKGGLLILKKNKPDLYLMSLLGIGSLFLMFLAGAYRIGESARAALFIYPYLLFPVIAYMSEIGKDVNERKQLLFLVFAQVLFMQLSGSFFW